jgi:crotonobetaine/carnitine-CoA ligase
MIAVVLSEGTLRAEDLHAFCRGRLPGFAMPRHIRFMHALPHTATNKVRKPELRDQGVTADTWTAP